MTAIEAVGLGALQGLTEFLPISSSGHLALAHYFLGERGDTLAFDVMLHVGTLVAVLLYFWRDWTKVGRSAIRLVATRRVRSEWDRLTLWLLIATLPAALFGKLLEGPATTTFRSPWVVVVAMAGLGLALLYAERRSRRSRGLSSMATRDAGAIGLSQALALVPGVSRSGITMTAALLLGFDRQSAARFSFLLSAPIIAGAGAAKIPDLLHRQGEVGILILGFAAATVSGVAAISLLLRYLRSHSFNVFAYYRLALAGAVALLLLGGY